MRYTPFSLSFTVQKTEGSHPASLFNSSNCTKVTGKSAQIEPGKTGPQKETLIICSRRQKQSLFSPCLSLGNVLCVWFRLSWSQLSTFLCIVFTFCSACVANWLYHPPWATIQRSCGLCETVCGETEASGEFLLTEWEWPWMDEAQGKWVFFSTALQPNSWVPFPSDPAPSKMETTSSAVPVRGCLPSLKHREKVNSF